MSKPDIDLAAIAERLDQAAHTATATPQLSGDVDLSVEQAYEVQALSMQRRYDRGETQVGLKMGFTSKAKMEQMGVDEMIWGRLTSGMRVEEGGEVTLDDYVHPRVEPEVAVLLKKPLSGLVTIAEAQDAVEAVAPAMEIIDSRYKDFKFSWADVVADNSSSSGFVVGAWQSPQTDISNLGMVLEFDGRPVQIGSSAAILGNPWRSLTAASRIMAENDLTLEAGWLVLLGGATAAQALEPGVHVRNSVQTLGAVGFSVKG